LRKISCEGLNQFRKNYNSILEKGAKEAPMNIDAKAGPSGNSEQFKSMKVWANGILPTQDGEDRMAHNSQGRVMFWLLFN
jgi:hypothetical protein